MSKSEEKDRGIQFVYCPQCGEQAPDFGRDVKCEICGHAPMPYYNESGELVTE